MTVTKKDIVLKIANESGIKQIYVKKIVQKTLDTVTQSLAEGNTVELVCFDPSVYKP